MFAILFEALLIEIQEEIPHFAGWEGGLMGTKIVNKSFVNKLAFPNLRVPNQSNITHNSQGVMFVITLGGPIKSFNSKESSKAFPRIF